MRDRPGAAPSPPPRRACPTHVASSPWGCQEIRIRSRERVGSVTKGREASSSHRNRGGGASSAWPRHRTHWQHGDGRRKVRSVRRRGGGSQSTRVEPHEPARRKDLGADAVRAQVGGELGQLGVDEVAKDILLDAHLSVLRVLVSGLRARFGLLGWGATARLNSTSLRDSPRAECCQNSAAAGGARGQRPCSRRRAQAACRR